MQKLCCYKKWRQSLISKEKKDNALSGGKIEVLETVEDALKRKLKEEL